MGHFDGKVAIVAGSARGVLAARDALGLGRRQGHRQRPRRRMGWHGCRQPAGAAARRRDQSGRRRGERQLRQRREWEGGQNLIKQALETYQGDLRHPHQQRGHLATARFSTSRPSRVGCGHRGSPQGPLRADPFRDGVLAREGQEFGKTRERSRRVHLIGIGLFGNGGQAEAPPHRLPRPRGVARDGQVRCTANTIAPRARTRLTEGTFGEFKHEEGASIPGRREHLAMGRVLCSSAAAHITGQTFIVGGGEVDLVQGWTVVNKIEKNQPGRSMS